MELRLTKAKIDKVVANRGGKFRRRFASESAQRFARAIHFATDFLDLFRQTLQLRVASFDFTHPLGGAFAERDHLRN